MNSPLNARAEQLFSAGVEQLGEGNLSAAERSFSAALEHQSGFTDAMVNLAFVQDAQGATQAATLTYERALAAGANHFELHLNYGVMLARLARFDEAERSYLRAMEVDPQASALWSNLGALYLAIHRDDDAHTCLAKSIELRPDNTNAKFNLAYWHLIRGDYAQGWALLEARDWYARFYGVFQCPRWAGEAVRGLRLIVCYEAGMGDVVQFSRYVDELHARGAAHITLVCHPPLKPLLQTLKGCSQVLGFDEDLAALTSDHSSDYWTPLLSIPHYLETDAHSIPANIPYLSADPARVRTWEARLPNGAPRVGLVWKGNPNFANDAQRSLPHVHSLLPLWTVAGVAFVSLQKGQGEDEAASCAAQQPMTILGPDVRDFADTAAILECLDLVITVDTATAHVAGALGKECWVLLPYCMTDWRWLRTGEHSAWYPQGMRLFRQTQLGDWSPVVQDVRLALAAWVHARAARSSTATTGRDLR